MNKLITDKEAYIVANSIMNELRFAFRNDTNVSVEREERKSYLQDTAPMFRIFVRNANGYFLSSATIETSIGIANKHHDRYPDNCHWAVRLEELSDERGEVRQEPVFVVSVISENSKKAFNDTLNIKL